MFNPKRVSEKIAKDRQTTSARTGGLYPDPAADVFNLTTRCKSVERKIKAGCDLFSVGERGNAIYSLVDGWVALYNLFEDGRRQILQFALPGAVLAFVPAPGVMMTYSAQALTDAIVCVIPHESLGRLSRDYPEIGMQLAGQMSRDRSLAYDHLSSIGRRSARERIAHLLLELFIRFRMRWPGHRTEEMRLPLTQEHIGDATGLTNVHVNRVLRDLRQDGILEFHYRRLRVLNPDKLVDAAGVDPASLYQRLDVLPRIGPSAVRDGNKIVSTPRRRGAVHRSPSQLSNGGRIAAHAF